MDCKDIKTLIPVYLDNELEPQESQLVRNHLADCPHCQNEFEAYERSWAMLGEIEDIQPEPGFIGRFWTRLSLEQSWHEKLIGAVQENLLKNQLIPALATACIIVVMGSFALNNYFQTQKTNQVLASLNEEDFIIVENIELAENLDLIEQIDFLEDLDTIENLDIFESFSKTGRNERWS